MFLKIFFQQFELAIFKSETDFLLFLKHFVIIDIFFVIDTG